MAASTRFSEDFLESQLAHVQRQVVAVQDAQDDLFAEQRRQRRNAVVDLLLLAVECGADLDASVLRQPLLGDVHLRHDLDARGDGILEAQGRIHHVVQDAVDAEPDAEVLFIGLDVDVAGALFERFRQDQVHQLDDRRFLAGALQLIDRDLLFVRRFRRSRSSSKLSLSPWAISS